MHSVSYHPPQYFKILSLQPYHVKVNSHNWMFWVIQLHTVNRIIASQQEKEKIRVQKIGVERDYI